MFWKLNARPPVPPDLVKRHLQSDLEESTHLVLRSGEVAPASSQPHGLYWRLSVAADPTTRYRDDHHNTPQDYITTPFTLHFTTAVTSHRQVTPMDKGNAHVAQLLLLNIIMADSAPSLLPPAGRGEKHSPAEQACMVGSSSTTRPVTALLLYFISANVLLFGKMMLPLPTFLPTFDMAS